MRIREKLAWAGVVTLAIFVVASVTGVVSGGPLDPPGSPGSTMQPLDDVRGAWSRTLPADDGVPAPDDRAGCDSTRFRCVFEDNAVLDRETGLVWQRFVSGGMSSWPTAQCVLESAGPRYGWRLPSIAELQTLIAPALGDPPYLPAGHPFKFVSTTDPYWTSTPYDDTSQRTLVFDTAAGTQERVGGSARYWCVRGSE